MNVPLLHVPAFLAMVILSGPVIADTLDLSIQPVAGDLKVTPETPLVNRAGERWSVTRLSYLLSEPALQRGDGSWHPCESEPAWMSLASIFLNCDEFLNK